MLLGDLYVFFYQQLFSSTVNDNVVEERVSAMIMMHLLLRSTSTRCGHTPAAPSIPNPKLFNNIPRAIVSSTRLKVLNEYLLQKIERVPAAMYA